MNPRLENYENEDNLFLLFTSYQTPL